MATTYVKTVNGNRVQIHANANAAVVVVGADGVSNLLSNTSEIVYNAVITKVIHGAPVDAYWKLERGTGASNTLVGVYNGTGEQLYDVNGTTLSVNSTGANLYLTLVGSANGYILVEMKKNV
jgi:hypothetical protein